MFVLIKSAGYKSFSVVINLIAKNHVVKNKEKNLALLGASVFLAVALAIGTWIRKL